MFRGTKWAVEMLPEIHSPTTAEKYEQSSEWVMSVPPISRIGLV